MATIPTNPNRGGAHKSLAVGAVAVTFGRQLALAQAQLEVSEGNTPIRVWESLPISVDDEAPPTAARACRQQH